jgi:malate dehydrogenase
VSNHKLTIVGAGNVGATTAHIAAGRNLGEIVLLDIVKGLAEGKALDIAEAGPVQNYESAIIGTMDWEKTAGSSIVVITSGLARKPGMSRDDLLAKNVQIIKQVSENIVKYCPDSIVIVVANPLDAMVYTASKVTGFDKKRIMGMAGALDAARFSYFVASELGVSSQDVRGILMGGHGDDMVPLPRFTTVSGIPITDLLDKLTINRLIDRTRNGGIEVVNLLGSSAFYAPAAGVVKMAEAIIRNTKSIIPCCAYCKEEYNAGGYFVGVPVVLGKGGVEKVIELKLNEDERAEFDKSLEHVRRLSEQVDRLL